MITRYSYSPTDKILLTKLTCFLPWIETGICASESKQNLIQSMVCDHFMSEITEDFLFSKRENNTLFMKT